jgi:urea transport system permease protein
MNQPLMVTAAQRAGTKVTIAVGAVILALLIALPLLSLLPESNRCKSRPTP